MEEFLLSFGLIFVAELGDKTMLGTVTLAASYSLVLVWIGSTLGMVLSDGLAIWVGQALGKKLPERSIKIGAAGIFFSLWLPLRHERRQRILASLAWPEGPLGINQWIGSATRRTG